MGTGERKLNIPIYLFVGWNYRIESNISWNKPLPASALSIIIDIKKKETRPYESQFIKNRYLRSAYRNKEFQIVDREYAFNMNVNYVLVGLRRAEKINIAV